MPISTAEADSIVSTKTAPRVTREDIVAAIVDTTFYVHGVLTVCVATMRNGFKLVGKSAPASPANFDAEVGKRYALDDCINQAWPLMGYALLEKLSGA